MPRAKQAHKTRAPGLFDEEEQGEDLDEEELPKDEAGRRKIKKRYEELLGIRGLQAAWTRVEPGADQ